jgi:hypothetical protein
VTVLDRHRTCSQHGFRSEKSSAATLINWLSHQKNRPPEGTVGRGSHPQADRINKGMDQ